MYYPVNGQFNIGNNYNPYTTMGTNYGNPYQTPMFNNTYNNTSNGGFDSSSMMQLMMQMKQIDAMNNTTTTDASTANTIATGSSASSSADTTELGNYETDGSDLEAVRDFLNNQNKASTLRISNDLSGFATNLLEALNDEAGFSEESDKISLSRMLNSLGISLAPNQAELLAYNMGINPEDIDANDIAVLLKNLGFKDGENNRYNLSIDMQKSVDKINNTSSFKIKSYADNANDTSKMTTEQFNSVFNMFVEDGAAGAKLQYGSLDNLSDQLIKAANKGSSLSANSSKETVSLDDLLKTLGLDVDVMSDEEKARLYLKTGMATLTDSDNTEAVEKPRIKTNQITNNMSNWAVAGEIAGGAVGGAAIGGMIGGIPGAVIGAIIGGGVAHGLGSASKHQSGASAKSLNLGGTGYEISAATAGDVELSKNQVKELLKTLGFGEKEITKSKLEQGLKLNISFNKNNIKNAEGVSIFNEVDALYGSTGNNMTSYETLIGTILKSSGEYQQAAIEAYFDDFIEYSKQLLDTYTKLYGSTIFSDDNGQNVQKVQLIFVGAQELIEATTDPAKKVKYKQIYNQAVQTFAQEWANSGRLMIGQDCKTDEIAKALLYTSSQVEDYNGGTPV